MKGIDVSKRKRKIEKQEREKYEPGTFECFPHALLDAGTLISWKARTVYMVLLRYNPCFPSYKTIMHQGGIRTRKFVAQALRELEAKCMVKRFSGSSHQENNVYLITRLSDWRLSEKPAEEAVDNFGHQFPGGTTPSSHRELVPSSPAEQELSQSQPSQLTVEEQEPLWITSEGMGSLGKTVH